jgi:hypothetical protein
LKLTLLPEIRAPEKLFVSGLGESKLTARSDFYNDDRNDMERGCCMTRDHSHLTGAQGRALGDMEKLFWASSVESNLNWVQTIRVAGKVTPNDMRRALDVVLRRHPLLPVCVELGSDEIPRFEHFPDCQAPLRVAERKDDDTWIQEAQTEINDPIDPSQPPLLRAVLVEGERTSEILLCGTHCNIDGRSIIVIVEDLMRALGRLPPLPVLGLQLPFEELYPPLRATTTQTESHEPAGAPVDQSSNAHEDNSTSKAGNSAPFKIDTWQLDRAETDRLVESCRKRQVTVHAAICAAFLSSFERLSQEPGRELVFCASPINLRSACPPVKDDVGVFISMLVLIHQLGRGMDFWALARWVKEQINQANHPQYIVAVHSGLREKMAILNTREILEWSRQTVSYEFGITNLGRLEIPLAYGPLQIERLWPPVAVSNPAADTVAVFTFDGQLAVMITSIEDRREFGSLAIEYLKNREPV